MDDETNVSSLPKTSNPPLSSVVVPETIPSNPPKPERWVPYRNPRAQERTDPSKREDESYATSPASDANITNENSVQPNEIPSSLPSDLVEVIKRYNKRYWNLAPDGSFAMSTKTKKQKRKKRPGGQYDHDAWEENYQLLVQYKNKHGTTRVPQRYGKLGSWVQRQRSAHKKHKLSLDRQQKLSSIDFKWNGNNDKSDDPWKKMYQKLVAYNKKYGNTCVPDSWKEDPKLANWVKRQRYYCKEQYRIELLNDIAFVWDANDQRH